MSIKKHKLSKSKFEKMLTALNCGITPKCVRRIEEGLSLYAYYGAQADSSGIHQHIGTWRNGICWAFCDK
jgi:hypothetical protein